MLKIGEFSALAQVSVKTLRYYDEVGLLRPVRVDPDSGLALLPFVLAIPQGPVHWSTRGIGALCYLITFGSLVGYSAYVYAIDRLPVAIVSIYPYVNAVVAVTLGWLFYREPFGKREMLAMLIIFTGVAVVKRYSQKPAKG